MTAAPIDRLREIMRRFRAREERNDKFGPWLGINEIRRALGATKDEVRSLLLELVAAGEVETMTCASGTFWCLTRPKPAPLPVPGPKVFVLQREIVGPSGRGTWFDAEAFDTEEVAARHLLWRRWEAQARINGNGGSGYTGERAQRIRLVRLIDVPASAMSARSDETQSGSVRQDASATAESRDAQTTPEHPL